MKLKKFFIFLIIQILIINISLITFASVEKPDLTAEAAILMDSSSDKILYSRNANEKMYPASTTKIMTAILTLESCNLDDIVTVPYDAIVIVPSGYSVASLQAGEEVTVKQLLQMTLVHSANDAANVLAFYISGSIEDFAVLMNNKVSDLGLENTHFTNPSGKHDENHYTTAYDLAKIMQYCMKNSTFRTLAGLKSCTIPATNKYEERVFTTTNELLIVDNRDVASNYYYEYAIAGKTGYTTEAKNCLVSVSNKDDLELISVVLSVGLYENGLSGKFIESKALFNYGYGNYTIKKLREKNAIATQIEIKNATKDTKNLDLLIPDDITVLINQENLDKDYEPEIEINDDLTAPIAQNQKIGKITYEIEGITYSEDLIAANNVEKSGFSILAIQIVLAIFILFILYKLLFGNKNNGNRLKGNKKNRKPKYIYK